MKLDLAILGHLVRFLSRFPRVTENADWQGMLNEFGTTIFQEMDYVQEGHNAERFRENFKTWRVIHVPVIYWSHTTSSNCFR